jgi:hypothetical protein
MADGVKEGRAGDEVDGNQRSRGDKSDKQAQCERAGHAGATKGPTAAVEHHRGGMLQPASHYFSFTPRQTALCRFCNARTGLPVRLVNQWLEATGKSTV